MTKLPKFTLTHDEAKKQWRLEKDQTDRATKIFATKAEATAGGALSTAVGKAGGSVKIQKTDGSFQEERTYPRSADPKKSPG